MNPRRRFLGSTVRIVAAALAFVVAWNPTSLRGAEAPAARPLMLEPVYRSSGSNGLLRLVPRSHLEFEKVKLESVAFLAVVTNGWPAGLVPIFAVEKSGRVELRRRPPVGMESSLEPLFFGLPPEDEPETPKLAGRWECRAVRGGNTDHLTWELTIEGDRVAGRFDQTQEYRVATIAGGTFRSNRLELRVEYFMDRYVLNGVWRNGRLSGDWRHVDDSERGIWEATRNPARVAVDPGVEVVAVYEWGRVNGGNEPRYAIADEKLPPEWERASRPLCRVWRRESRASQ